MRRAIIVSALVVAFVAAAQPAGAQTSTVKKGTGDQPPKTKQGAGAQTPKTKQGAGPLTSKVWKGIGFIAVDAGAQVTSSGYTANTTFTLHAEDATFTATTAGQAGPVFNARAGFRLWRNLAVGVGATVFSATPPVSVTARLPHPFYFNQPREVSGTATGLERQETMVAVEVSWLMAVSRRFDLNLFAGPAFFNLRQDMATSVQFTETYPYDTATFTGVETTSVSDSPIGVTAGADVSFLLSKHFGVGGLVRYSYAAATLAPTSGQSTSIDAGGLQVGGGIRIRF